MLFAVACLITACSGKRVSTSLQTIPVTIQEPNHIQFQGKGAGAGMALMSTMGSMGIALGVAIDEGIAKDIREAAGKAGFSVDDTIVRTLKDVSQGGLAADVGVFPAASEQIVVHRYGFKTTGGENDATSAEVEVEVVREGQVVGTFHYPDDLPDNQNLPAYPLEELKQQGEKANELLSIGFAEAFKGIIEFIR